MEGPLLKKQESGGSGGQRAIPIRTDRDQDQVNQGRGAFQVESADLNDAAGRKQEKIIRKISKWKFSGYGRTLDQRSVQAE